MQEASNISMTISTGWVSTPSTSRKQKTACTPASRLYTATGVLLPLWSDYWERLMKKSCSPTRSWKTFVADHDRYWKPVPTNWKVCCQPKTVVGHKTGSSDRNADGMKTADNDGLVILPDGRKYYIAAFVMDLARRMRTMRTSSPAYHAWYMMRWDERGKGGW